MRPLSFATKLRSLLLLSDRVHAATVRKQGERTVPSNAVSHGLQVSRHVSSSSDGKETNKKIRTKVPHELESSHEGPKCSYGIATWSPLANQPFSRFLCVPLCGHCAELCGSGMLRCVRPCCAPRKPNDAPCARLHSRATKGNNLHSRAQTDGYNSVRIQETVTIFQHFAVFTLGQHFSFANKANRTQRRRDRS